MYLMLAMMTFDLPHPILALLSLTAGAAAFAATWHKRPRIGKAIPVLVGIAAMLLALAAGDVRMSIPSQEQVQVMVDLSPSTRGAKWRDSQWLKRRIETLLGAKPYRVIAFGEKNEATGDVHGLKEMPSNVTRFAPPEPWPVLLFSDGQFELPPAAPPTFAVVDGAMDEVKDAFAVQIVHERGDAIAIIENHGNLRIANGMTIPSGRFRLRLGPATQAYAVKLSPAKEDLWPENDQLVSLPEQPGQLARWSVGVSGDGLEEVSANRLPASAEGYTFVSELVLDAGAAGGLPEAQQQAIAAYVQELGGTVVLVGQDAKWTMLRGTVLGRISPLSVDPPGASEEWTVLVDASGSMAQADRGVNKWQLATDAARRMVQGLPGGDAVRAGTFAADVRWWDTGRPADVAAEGMKLPREFTPHGPTNLESALQQVLRLPPVARRELLLMTDAEVELKEQALATKLRDAHVRVSCLLLGEGRGKKAIEELCRTTGGVLLEQAEPAKWVEASRDLARSAAPSRWQNQPIIVGQRQITGWNLAWAKQDATVVTKAASGEPLAAKWNVGAGQVGAIAFAASPEVLGTFASRPADEQSTVTWNSDSVAVRVQAREQGRFTLRLTPSAPEEPVREVALSQVAPDRYAADLPTTASGAVATLYRGHEVLARHAIAPRYPPEFDHIGNNRPNLTALCRQTGGRVVEETERQRLDIHLSRRFVDMAATLGAGAVGMLAWAAILLRRRI